MIREAAEPKNSDPPLSKDAFTRDTVKNFVLHFMEGAGLDSYRNTPAYQALINDSEGKKLADELRIRYVPPQAGTLHISTASAIDDAQAFQDERQRRIDQFEANKENLYKAYLIMREHVSKDWDLFM